MTMTPLDLIVTDNPEYMTPRRRSVWFEAKDLEIILVDYCRSTGMSISNDCSLSIDGMAITGRGASRITLCIKGD